MNRQGGFRHFFWRQKKDKRLGKRLAPEHDEKDGVSEEA